MKKRTKFLIALLLLLVVPVSLLTAGMMLPEFYGDTYYAVLSRMHSRLETAENPKIIVLGGSNVAFGLYAAVGTSAMLDLSEDDLGAGDLVVLAVEPTSETMSAYFGAEAFWKCAESDPSLLPEVSREKQAALIGNYVPYLQQRCDIL